MNWKEQIDEQIARLRSRWWGIKPPPPEDIKIADTMQALLDVAVAAEQWSIADTSAHTLSCGDTNNDCLACALDKLREVSGE